MARKKAEGRGQRAEGKETKLAQKAIKALGFNTYKLSDTPGFDF